jgi:hypothetical protein
MLPVKSLRFMLMSKRVKLFWRILISSMVCLYLAVVVYNAKIGNVRGRQMHVMMDSEIADILQDPRSRSRERLMSLILCNQQDLYNSEEWPHVFCGIKLGETPGDQVAAWRRYTYAFLIPRVYVVFYDGSTADYFSPGFFSKYPYADSGIKLQR